METKSVLPYNFISSLSLVIAPLLFGASTFFWTNGEYGVTGGTVLALATVFWIMAFVTLFDKLKPEMPLYSSIGLVIAIYGSISGNNFGMVGVFSEAFDISHDTYLNKASEYPLGFNLLLFWAGPLFPLSLFVLGINLMRKKVVPGWVGIMICLGAIAFPLSRIPRIEMIAHAADLLIAIPLISIGLKDINR
jgi:hypothetical protein